MNFPEIIYDTGKPVAKITYFIGMERTNVVCEKSGTMSDELYAELSKRLRPHIVIFNDGTRKAINDFRDAPTKFWRTNEDGTVEPD